MSHTQTIRRIRAEARSGIEAFLFAGLEQAFGPHVHSHWVIGLMRAGERRVRCAGGEFQARAGQMLVFSPGEPHECAGEGPFGWLGLNIPSHLLPASRPRALHEPDVTTVALFSRLHAAVLGGSPLTGAQAAAMSRALFQRLPRTGPAQPLEDTLVERLKRHIAARCASGVGLAELEALSGISRFHLVRRFGSAAGITPWRYLESARVARACELLRAGMPPAHAAQEAGFADQSHLTRLMRRLTGFTPARYRRLLAPSGARR